MPSPPPPSPPPPPPLPAVGGHSRRRRRRQRLLDNVQRPLPPAATWTDQNSFHVQRGPLTAQVVRRQDRRYNHMRIDQFLYEANILLPRDRYIHAQSSMLPFLDDLVHEVTKKILNYLSCHL
jgi:hypothetical protein